MKTGGGVSGVKMVEGGEERDTDNLAAYSRCLQMYRPCLVKSRIQTSHLLFLALCDPWQHLSSKRATKVKGLRLAKYLQPCFSHSRYHVCVFKIIMYRKEQGAKKMFRVWAMCATCKCDACSWEQQNIITFYAWCFGKSIVKQWFLHAKEYCALEMKKLWHSLPTINVKKH